MVVFVQNCMYLLLFNFDESYCYYYYIASITLYIVTIYLNNIWN